MKYAALFRGINVGGKNIVKMAELKELFSVIGFADVKTYIQSGNVIFSSQETTDIIKSKIQKGFVNAFGFDSAVIIRSEGEFAKIINGLPFSQKEILEAYNINPDVEHLYVYLAEAAIEQGSVADMEAKHAGVDRLSLVDREIYLLCQNSIRDSKLAASLAKLNVPTTARNWKTISKLYELMRK